MPDNSTPLGRRLALVRDRIAAAEQRFGRTAGSVHLLAVSKTQPPDAIRNACRAGQRAFGENYLQEAVAKQVELADLPLEWHCIGPVQANKAKSVAARFDWVHSVDRTKLAERLAAHRPETLPPLNVLLQVNVSGEESKTGVTPTELPMLAASVVALPRLRLRGLMCIPAPTPTFERQREPFRLLRRLLESLRDDGYAMDSLSMGMSDDLEAAIAEGATLVRVGTAIFGSRPVQTR